MPHYHLVVVSTKCSAAPSYAHPPCPCSLQGINVSSYSIDIQHRFGGPVGAHSTREGPRELVLMHRFGSVPGAALVAPYNGNWQQEQPRGGWPKEVAAAAAAADGDADYSSRTRGQQDKQPKQQHIIKGAAQSSGQSPGPSEGRQSPLAGGGMKYYLGGAIRDVAARYDQLLHRSKGQEGRPPTVGQSGKEAAHSSAAKVDQEAATDSMRSSNHNESRLNSSASAGSIAHSASTGNVKTLRLLLTSVARQLMGVSALFSPLHQRSIMQARNLPSSGASVQGQQGFNPAVDVAPGLEGSAGEGAPSRSSRQAADPASQQPSAAAEPSRGAGSQPLLEEWPLVVFHGACIWDGGQLEGEIRSGAWGITVASSEDVQEAPLQLWLKLISSKRLVWM